MGTDVEVMEFDSQWNFENPWTRESADPLSRLPVGSGLQFDEVDIGEDVDIIQ